MLNRAERDEIKKSIVLIIALLMGLAISAQAGLITFSDRSEVLNDASGSSVLTAGINVVAANMYGGGVGPVINGITFESLGLGGSITGNGVTMGAYDLGGTAGKTFDDAITTYTENSGLAALMSKTFVGAYYANGVGVSLTGLTIGVEYQLQGFYWDKATGGTIQYVRDADNVTNRSVTFQTSASPTGYSWTATWVADSITKSIEVIPGPSSRALLSGASLQVIPEPTTIGLFMISSIGLLLGRHCLI